jgi:hypothetical protein
VNTNRRPTEGKALLESLNELFGAIDFDENGKPRRRNSPYIQSAATALRKAILDAGDRFKRHKNFTSWLGSNNCEYIEAYDPLRMTDEVVEAIRELRWRVKMLDDQTTSILENMIRIASRLPPLKEKEEA